MTPSVGAKPSRLYGSIGWRERVLRREARSVPLAALGIALPSDLASGKVRWGILLWLYAT
jgi:hypothetical protein